MSRICVKDMGNGLSTVWCPEKTIHQMRMEEDNPHLSFLEKMFDVNNFLGTPSYDKLKRNWVDSRFFRTEEINGFTYGVTYDMKLRIIKNKVICKNLYTMYLDEKETQDEIVFSKTKVKVLKTISNK